MKSKLEKELHALKRKNQKDQRYFLLSSRYANWPWQGNSHSCKARQRNKKKSSNESMIAVNFDGKDLRCNQDTRGSRCSATSSEQTREQGTVLECYTCLLMCIRALTHLGLG